MFVIKTQVGVLPNGTPIPYTFWKPSQQAWLTPISFITVISFSAEFSEPWGFFLCLESGLLMLSLVAHYEEILFWFYLVSVGLFR
jgi:hypothetical protein